MFLIEYKSIKARRRKFISDKNWVSKKLIEIFRPSQKVCLKKSFCFIQNPTCQHKVLITAADKKICTKRLKLITNKSAKDKESILYFWFLRVQNNSC